MVVIPLNKLVTDTDAPVNAPDNVLVDAPVNVQDATMESKILVFCKEPKGVLEILKMLGYSDKRTVRKYLNPLIEEGRLAMTVPDKPTSKNQKYITIK